MTRFDNATESNNHVDTVEVVQEDGSIYSDVNDSFRTSGQTVPPTFSQPSLTVPKEIDNKEDNNGYDDGASTVSDETDFVHQRDPFWAFVPHVWQWATTLLRHEASYVQRGVTGCPVGSHKYCRTTVTFYRAHPRVFLDEILSGFTVAIMQVPESIAFSFVAGVPPLSGLQATFWMATVTGLLGGKPGMISGAAGALAVVLAQLTADDGVLSYLTPLERLNVLFLTVFATGLFQILFAILRLAKLVRLIPETGMIGFMNGLAVIIFMAQLPAFQYCTAEPLFIECSLEQRQWLTFRDNTWQLILTLLHVAMCMLIMKFFPKVPKVGKFIPASLVGLLVGTLFEQTLFRRVFGVATRTVAETAPLSGAPPHFDWPNHFPVSDTFILQQVCVYGVTLAAIGGVESVLTLQACHEITDTVPAMADAHRELFAQGVGNAVCGVFRAMGGSAMIGQSTINVMNGARHRVSSTMSGIFMLLFIIVLSPLIDLLPIGTLTGVLFMVVLSTFQYKTFMILRYGRLSDSLTILLVTIIAVFVNLAIAIGVGIIFSSLVHAWDSGSHVEADIAIKNMLVNGVESKVKYVHLRGAIFFSSTRKFVNMFSVADDPSTIVLDFKDALIIDHSAVAAIQGLSHRFDQAGKRVLLTNLPIKSSKRLHRTGNHVMLKSQITSQSKLENTDEESHARPLEQIQADSLPIGHGLCSESVDEFGAGRKLSRMRIFQSPIDPVATEIALLRNG